LERYDVRRFECPSHLDHRNEGIDVGTALAAACEVSGHLGGHRITESHRRQRVVVRVRGVRVRGV
jgi:hypothetical protein